MFLRVLWLYIQSVGYYVELNFLWVQTCKITSRLTYENLHGLDILVVLQMTLRCCFLKYQHSFVRFLIFQLILDSQAYTGPLTLKVTAFEIFDHHMITGLFF
jgi:hypothetical protein